MIKKAGDVMDDKIRKLEEELKSLKAEKYKRLDLKPSDKENLKTGMRKDGKPYSVRDNRDRFFYPNEWGKFFDCLKESQRLTFKFLINTGCRINEARNIKCGDVDLENKRIIVRVTKVKAKRGEKNPRPRTIPISSQFAKYLKKVITDKDLKNEDYFGLLSTPASHIALKKALQKAGLKDWYMFSIHNIRKTLETWLMALNVDGLKIVSHFGHSKETASQHYISPDVFRFEEKSAMRIIIGDLYQRVY